MSAIIFDFDGTIANSFDYVVNFLAEEAKLAPLTAEQKSHLHDMPMAAIAKTLGLPWWRMPQLFWRGRVKMGKAIRYVEPFAGMEEVVRKCHEEGHELYIVSSNVVRNLHDFLVRHEMQQYFLEIYGGVGLFGKAPALRRLVKEQNLEVKHCVYVGDEVRDVEAAQAVKMRAVAVSWGFARKAHLEKLQPYALANTPLELMRVLEEL